MKRFFLEVAVDSLEGLEAAEREGADRVELCAHLDQGGISPSDKLFSEVVEKTRLPVRVMVRPRGGNFVYSKEEFQLMMNEILRAKKAGIEGVVFGMLLNEENIDVERTKVLVDLAKPMKSTFHRAFDIVRNPIKLFDHLVATGVDTVLTSGGKPSAEQGVATIAQLEKKSNGRISILAGGGIRGSNVVRIVKTTAVNAVHVGAGLGTSRSVKEIAERIGSVRRELDGLDNPQGERYGV